MKKNIKIGVIGLGYVGLPLARLFATKYAVVGFDIDEDRVNDLKQAVDKTNELSAEDLKEVLVNALPDKKGLFCSSHIKDIADCNYYIVTVPTPIDEHKRPFLIPLLKASETVGSLLSKGDVVVYESTVYPGTTEEECVPVLERISGLKFNEDFYVGYSPERINPGDKSRPLEKILKITAGSTPTIAKNIDQLYASVIEAGTYLAQSIKIAESAKVIENAQRDVNIAFVNELAKIFNILNIDTLEVLKAAGTKWNFLKFTPGLVGGHCIGVDPYYLYEKASNVGYHTEMIAASRRINDGMGKYIAEKQVKAMIEKGIKIKNAKVLVLGIAFKENCPDIRNTKVVDVVKSLKSYHIDVDVYDPIADAQELRKSYQIEILQALSTTKYDGILLAVAHQVFLEIDLSKITQENKVIYDIKGFLPKNLADIRL